MKIFRAFFKEFSVGPDGKSMGCIEFKAKRFRTAVVKAEKEAQRKRVRLVMVAEIARFSGAPDHL